MENGRLPVKLQKVQEKVSETLTESLDFIASLREDKLEHLHEVRMKRASLQKELEDVIIASQNAEEEYRKSRMELMEASRSNNKQCEQDAYNRAAHLMKIRGAFEEREKSLCRMRDDLDREERRTENFLERSEHVANRFRVALEFISSNIDEALGASENYDLNSMKMACQLAERESRALARDLHDGPVQRFSSAVLQLETAQEYIKGGDINEAVSELEKTRNQIQEALGDIRALLFQLNPTGLSEGLDSALDRLAKQVWSSGGPEVCVRIEGDQRKVPLSFRRPIFKIIHQAVANAFLHGKAREVSVRIDILNDVMRVRISDDGRGFDVKKERMQAAERGSYGLISMEERAMMIGGNLRIESEPGRGTAIHLSVPLSIFSEK